MATMTITPAGNVQHYPINLTNYGKNPYGGNLYRVVFAPSVRHLVGGKWKDGTTEYRSRPTYRHLGNEWILERWVTGEDFCRMSRTDYEIRFRNESGLFTMGPYPVEGTYVMCMDSPIKVEAIPSIGQLIAGIEFGRNNRSREREVKNHQLMNEDLAASENATDQLLLDKIKELRPAFGNRPTSFASSNGSSGIHSTKSTTLNNAPKFLPKKSGGLKVLKEN